MLLGLALGLQLIVAFPWAIIALYLLLLSIVALRCDPRRDITQPWSALPVRIGIIIPAHNEERTLEDTLPSFQRLDYPSSSYEIIVVADNCTDLTADMARRQGIAVYERHDLTRRGKGWALGWIFDSLLKTRADFDAFVVVDADSILSPNFLQVMAERLNAGWGAIQARNTVMNAAEGWRPALMSLSFALNCHLRSFARSCLGLSVGLKGTGMCLSREALLQVPWQASSLAEDQEYSLELVLHGIRVAYGDKAVVNSPMPVKGTQAQSQAIRWEFGRLGVIARYAPRLCGRAILDWELQRLETALELCIPPTSLLFGLPSFLLVVDFLLWAAFDSSQAGLLASVWGALLLGAMMYVGAGFAFVDSPRQVLRALLHVPTYVLWKGTVLLKGWFTDQREWVRTPRRRIR